MDILYALGWWRRMIDVISDPGFDLFAPFNINNRTWG